MISKNTRTFEIDGKTVRFNSIQFKELFMNYRNRTGMSAAELEEEISKEASVSTDSVHNWRFGSNGPGDPESIKAIAKVLELNDWMLLMTEVKEDEMEKLTDIQLLAVKRIYDAAVSFLDEFQRSDGFNAYWFDIADRQKYKTVGEWINK